MTHLDSICCLLSQELYRTEVQKSESELILKDRIIEDYKSICKSRETILENEKIKHDKVLNELRSKIDACETCSSTLKGTLELVETNNEDDPKQNDLIQKMADLRAELIQTKLDLAEANAKNDASFTSFYEFG